MRTEVDELVAMIRTEDGPGAALAAVVDYRRFVDEVIRVEAISPVAEVTDLALRVAASERDKGDDVQQEGGLRRAPRPVQVGVLLLPNL